MNILKKHIHISVWFLLTLQTSYWAFWIEKVKTWLQGESTPWDISTTLQEILIYLLWFLGLVAVVFMCWAWFQILTAADDEEKVKKGKKTLLFVLIGLFIIWIAWALVYWVTFGLEKSMK